MPLKLSVGLAKKIGQPGYGSLSANCNLEVELDECLLENDQENLQRQVRSRGEVSGGIARGKVVSGSDALGGDVADTPISPKDMLATEFHLFGIDPHDLVTDLLSRSVPIAGDGLFRTELF